jgi:hypothetical protein
MRFLQMSAANYADAENFIARISGNPGPATGCPVAKALSIRLPARMQGWRR